MESSKKQGPAGTAGDAKHSGTDTATALSALEFARQAAAVLARIEQGVLDANVGADADFVSDGVLEVEFDDGAKMIVNRHDVSREIWVAGRTGAFHFRWDGSGWVDTRSGESIWRVVSTLASQMANQHVVLD